MPCTTINMTDRVKATQEQALERLRKALATGTASVVVGPNGGVAFRGWPGERGMLFDLCAYRKLLASNSPELRRALAKAEAMSGQKVNQATIAAGVHSHDGGQTWGKG